MWQVLPLPVVPMLQEHLVRPIFTRRVSKARIAWPIPGRIAFVARLQTQCVA